MQLEYVTKVHQDLEIPIPSPVVIPDGKTNNIDSRKDSAKKRKFSGGDGLDISGMYLIISSVQFRLLLLYYTVLLDVLVSSYFPMLLKYPQNICSLM